MIRFRTIDPAEAGNTAEKPPVKPVASSVATEAPKPEASKPEASKPEAETEAEAEGGAKPKGLSRKTPLRARKPASPGLFRD